MQYKALRNQVLTSGDYSIVPIRSEDRFLIMQWRNEQIYHLRQNRQLTIEDQDYYFKNVVSKLFDQDKPDQLLFSFLKDEKCVGYGGVVHINWADQHAEISFILDTSLEKCFFESYWKIFLKLIEQVGFLELNLHKLFTFAFDLRPNLYKAIESVGFSKEAVLSQHVVFESQFKDVVIHSKIRNRPWLREADIFDTEQTFRWASNSQVRQFSFNSDPIAYAEHYEWFTKKIESKNCLYLIFENANDKLGSIRFDFDEFNNATISYLIEPAFHGKGYGKIILEMGLTKLQSISRQNLNITGYVKSENIASVKIFEKLNFRLTENKNHVLKFEKELLQ